MSENYPNPQGYAAGGDGRDGDAPVTGPEGSQCVPPYRHGQTSAPPFYQSQSSEFNPFAGIQGPVPHYPTPYPPPYPAPYPPPYPPPFNGQGYPTPIEPQHVPLAASSPFAPEPQATEESSNPTVEEFVSSMPPKPKKKVVTSRGKQSNFTGEEDIVLCKAWLEISCDPVTNTGQRKEGIWNRVTTRYNAMRGNFPVRTLKSLTCRWDTIRPECQKFAGVYSEVLRSNQSGMTDHDKSVRACTNFLVIHKKQFNLMHCWDILKNEPKWEELASRGNNNDSTVGGDGNNATKSINLDAYESSPGSSSAKRPLGRDATKASRKKANSGSSSSSEYMSSLRDLTLEKAQLMKETDQQTMETYVGIQMRKIQVEEEKLRRQEEREEQKLQIEKERLQLEKQREEKREREQQDKEFERILSINLNDCPSALREYYEKKQNDILSYIRQGK